MLNLCNLCWLDGNDTCKIKKKMNASNLLEKKNSHLSLFVILFEVGLYKVK